MKISRSWITVWILGVILGIGTFSLQKWRSSSQVSVKPRIGPIVESVYGIGTVTSRRVFRLKYGVLQTISKVFVHEGDFVKKDAPLIEADGRTTRAPFDGTVIRFPFEVGENVFPQEIILTLSDLKDRYILVALEQQGALRVVKDQPVVIIFDSLRGRRFAGHVASIYPNDDQFMVRVESTELPAEIIPGMTADVAIEVGKKEKALLVPVAALSRGRVTIQREGQKKNIEIKVGTIDGQWAEVLDSSILENDEIFVKR